MPARVIPAGRPASSEQLHHCPKPVNQPNDQNKRRSPTPFTLPMGHLPSSKLKECHHSSIPGPQKSNSWSSNLEFGADRQPALWSFGEFWVWRRSLGASCGTQSGEPCWWCETCTPTFRGRCTSHHMGTETTTWYDGIWPFWGSARVDLAVDGSGAGWLV